MKSKNKVSRVCLNDCPAFQFCEKEEDKYIMRLLDQIREKIFVKRTKQTSEECGIPWVYLVSPEIFEKYSKEQS